MQYFMLENSARGKKVLFQQPNKYSVDQTFYYCSYIGTNLNGSLNQIYL